MGDLLKNLVKIERDDVKQELQAEILKDCQGVENFSHSDVKLFSTRRDLLSVQVQNDNQETFSHIFLFFRKILGEKQSFTFRNAYVILNLFWK